MKPWQGVKAVLFDWAGTTVDYGSRSPTQVFVEIFRRRGVEITVEEARGPMGRAKHEHIAMVASLPRISAMWRDVHGRNVNDDDIQAMYHDFLPLQKEILRKGSDVIPGVAETVSILRRNGILIGSTTGYTRELMEVVVPIAAEQGYAPDVVICSNDVPAGRPAPWMNLLAAQRLGVYPLSSIVAVDDTPVGIEAGRNAGMKTIGVTLTGNLTGLSESEVQGLTEVERDRILATAGDAFTQAGADLVLPSVARLPWVLGLQ